MAEVIISRADAKTQGLKRYFIGQCVNGHISERLVSNGQCLACARERKRSWRASSAEATRRVARAYRAANADKYRASTQRWQATREGKAVKARLQRERRARIRGAGGKHTAQDLTDILNAQAGRCAYCRSDVRMAYEVDHIVALAKGGTNDRKNIQILCPPCNRRKRTKDPARFAREMGMLI